MGRLVLSCTLVAPAAAQRGADISALLSGEIDPEGVDLVGLRFDNGAADFESSESAG